MSSTITTSTWKHVRARAGSFYRTRIRRDVPVLTLHRIGAGDGTSVAGLEKLLDYVAAEHQVLTLSELAQMLRRGTRLPKNALVLTFDDGTKDHFTLAAPALRKRGLRATFAVIGCTLFEQVVPPLYWFFHLLEHTKKESVRFGFPPYLPHLELELDATGRGMLAADDSPLRRIIQASEHGLAVEVVSALGEALEVDPPAASDLFMTFDEIRALVAEGHEAAGHSLRHQDVGEPDMATWVEDLHADFAVMNEAFGPRSHPYIYPFGRERSPAVHAKIKATGFCCAATTQWGTNTRHIDPYALQRIGVDDDTPLPFPTIY